VQFIIGTPTSIHHQVHYKLLDKVIALRRDWRSNFSKSLQPTLIKRSKFNKQLTEAVKEWIIQNTTPSSNTRNVINFCNDNGNKVKHAPCTLKGILTTRNSCTNKTSGTKNAVASATSACPPVELNLEEEQEQEEEEEWEKDEGEE
jgi:hypothetical protein